MLDNQYFGKLAAGMYNSAHIKPDGTLWTCGINTYGQLGHGDLDLRTVMTQVGTENNWSMVSIGLNHILAIKTDGTMWSCGHNDHGQLGLGNTDNRNTFTRVGMSNNWKYINCSFETSVAITTNGELYVFGANSDTLLIQTAPTKILTPTKINNDVDWKYADTSPLHIIAIKNDGSLWSWGNNGNGKLGQGHVDSVLTPTRVGVLGNWKCVWTQNGASFAMNNNNEVFACGANTEYALGLGHNNTVLSFTKLTGTYKSVSRGYFHTVLINTLGNMIVVGNGDSGALGTGNYDNKTILTNNNTGTNWEYVASGMAYTLAIKNDGAVYATGSNANGGRSGMGATNHSVTPIVLYMADSVIGPLPIQIKDIVTIAGGNKTITVTLIINRSTITIVTDPEDAIVELYYNDQWNIGKIHELPSGNYQYRAYVEQWINE